MLNTTPESTQSSSNLTPAPIKAMVALQKGQIWKAGENYVHIKEAGKRLVDYKMAKGLHRPGLRRHLASITTVQAFLVSQGAELVIGPAPEVLED